MAVRNIIDEDTKAVGRVPHELSAPDMPVWLVRFLLDELVQSCVLSKGIADAPRICHNIDGLVYSR